MTNSRRTLVALAAALIAVTLPTACVPTVGIETLPAHAVTNAG